MKPRKSADELVAIIMQEVRKRPDCSQVLDVMILPNIDGAPDHPNWKAGFTADGPSTAPAEAYQISRELSAQFDWDECR
ncbi:hypothetical protein [Bradyrhizobium sp. 187]|jgi:hypothetical protein|uniref:hypothetical protein n=1 Tax=Bradyrhizobium sp. 187 TaxID=2782655 RepID=UPI001FFE62E8|nr:hypothetical protein [Bradyrhizobium sp. 187]UPJ71050.1 hypothetical protein IVB19_25790 [Bradyrhizobium sp. 187]